MKHVAALSPEMAYARFTTMWPPFKLLLSFAVMLSSFAAIAQTISFVAKQQLSFSK